MLCWQGVLPWVLMTRSGLALEKSMGPGLNRSLSVSGRDGVVEGVVELRHAVVVTNFSLSFEVMSFPWISIGPMEVSLRVESKT